MPNRTYRFCATITAPGFLETQPVWARSHFEAVKQARREFQTTAFRGWPPRHLRLIVVNPEYEAVTDTDGSFYTRQQWEDRVRAVMEAERAPTLRTGLRLLADLVG